MIRGMFLLLLGNVFLRGRGVFYIGGSDILPPPLKGSDEMDALERLEKQDEAAKQLLIEHNLRLVAHIVKKYYTGTNDYDDLISVGIVGLIKAINTFDLNKAQRLSSYASTCVQNEILMMFRNAKRSQQDISLNEAVDTDKDGNNLILMDVISVNDDIVDKLDVKLNSEKLGKYIDEVLDAREKTVIALRYGLGGNDEKTQREIAKQLNISRSYVSRIETKALKKLRNRFDKG